MKELKTVFKIRNLEEYMTGNRLYDFISDLDKVDKKTSDAFTTQWIRFDKADNSFNFKDWVSDMIDPTEFFKNKIGLEVGCGPGSHSRVILRNGGNLISIDISKSVYKVAEELDYKNHILCRMDIYNHKFRPNSFDYILCVGVMQHLKDDKKAMKIFKKLLKKDGVLLLNYYSNTRKAMLKVEDLIRKSISWTNNDLKFYISFPIGTLDYAACNIYTNILRPTKENRFTLYKRLGLYKTIYDWFDRLSVPIIKRINRGQFVDLYLDEGFENIYTYEYNKSNHVGYGTKA